MMVPSLLDKKAIRGQLEMAADKVEKSDTYAAERLRELGSAVDGGAYSDAWAGSDIHSVIDVNAIVERYRNQKIKDGIVVVLEIIRNILIFAPLVVTWYGISSAVSAYGDVVTHHAELAKIPFILLWQQGFAGSLKGWQSFSAIAGADFFILLTVLVFTAIISTMTGFDRMRREQEAHNLGNLLAHALAGARLCLTTKNWAQPTNFVTRFDQVIDSFKEMVIELVLQMKEERKEIAKLAERQADETKLFSTFKQELNDSMKGVSSSVTLLQTSTSSLNTSVETLHNGVGALINPARQMAQQQGTLGTTLEQAVTLFEGQAKLQAEIVRQQDQWGSDLKTVLTGLENTLKEGVQQEIDFSNTVKEINLKYLDYLEQMKNEQEVQKDITNRIFLASEQLAKTIHLLDEWNNEISGVNVNMHEIVRRLASLAPSHP